MALAYTLLVGYISLAPVENLPEIDFKFSDKALHATMYLLMMTTWVWALKNIRGLSLLKIAVFIFCFGTVIEVLQGVLPFGRAFDLLDVLANAIGICVGSVLCNQTSFVKR